MIPDKGRVLRTETLPLTGENQKTIEAARAIEERDRPVEAAEYVLTAARWRQEQGFSGAAFELLRELEKLVPLSSLPTGVRAEVQLQKGLAQVWQGYLEEANASFQEVIKLSLVDQRPNLRARAIRGVGLSLHFGGDLSGARERYEQALAIALEASDSETAFTLKFDLVSLALEAGDFQRAENLLRELDAEPPPPLPLEKRLMLMAVRGELAAERGQLVEAETVFQKILRSARRRNIIALEVRAMRALGSVRLQQGRPGTAVRWFRNAMRRIELLGLFPEEVGIRLSYASALQLLDRVDEAADQLEAARSLANQVGDRSGLARATAFLGELQLELNELGAAELLLGQAGDLFFELGDQSLMIRSMQSLAAAKLSRGALEEAIETIESTLDRLTQRSQMDEIALLHRAGELLLTASNGTARAVSYFERSLAAAEQTKDLSRILKEAYSAGVALAAVGSTSNSVSFLDSALSAAVDLGNEQMVFQVRTARGRSLAAEQKFDDAQEDFESSLKLADLARDRAMASIAQMNLGVLERHKGNITSAAMHLETALSSARELGSELLEAKTILQLAEVYLAQQRWTDADKHFREAGKLAFDFGIAETDMRAAAGLASLAYMSRHFEDAIKFFDRAAQLGVENAPPQQLGGYLIGLAESVLAARKGRALGRLIRKIVKSALSAGRSHLTRLAFAMAGDFWLNHGRSEESAQFYSGSIFLSFNSANVDEEFAASIFREFIDSTKDAADRNLPEGSTPFYERVLSLLEGKNEEITDSLRKQFRISSLAT